MSPISRWRSFSFALINTLNLCHSEAPQASARFLQRTTRSEESAPPHFRFEEELCTLQTEASALPSSIPFKSCHSERSEESLRPFMNVYRAPLCWQLTTGNHFLIGDRSSC